MNAELAARRLETDSLIGEDSVVITGTRQPTKDNGMGGLVADPLGTPVAIGPVRVRIAHESSSVPSTTETPVGLGTNLSCYVITDYGAPLKEGDSIIANGETWIVGPVTPFLYLGRIYKTEAPLKACPSAALAIPAGLTATAKSSTAIDLAWTEANDINDFSLERKTKSGSFAVVGTIAAGMFVFHDMGLAPSTTYAYRLRESSGGAYSDYSATAESTTEAV
jgi:hypothetical protein